MAVLKDIELCYALYSLERDSTLDTLTLAIVVTPSSHIVVMITLIQLGCAENLEAVPQLVVNGWIQ